MPADHPAVPLPDPASPDDRIGRAPRRLNVDQLRASLLAATGFTWVAQRRVSDPDSPSGFSVLPDADMLEALAATLGRPDYLTSTSESIDPAVTFAKLAGDAARSACRMAVAADAKGEANPKRIMRHADVRQNLSYLALRFWARQVKPEDAQLDALATLFDRVSKDPQGSPAEAWRAVCIAMATDPQFLTY
jgi:hypothetical protein